ncbi:Uncharacterized protein TOPH_05356 [Tolypocladium ophioglossoides CBS 100239]|uniref:Uncharacterized protein n=1 Tax=Tolypocladium ophioglossoides (strain CBS 100239) TaxID=1163406 RepID=A0A0L0N7S8_TOLOC|nr:Uncharacterized protein TOPH_05356 [Tolypocladium ophioglossoides CBS 100239]
MASADDDQRAWFLRSTCPVDFPTHDALTKSRAEFDSFLANELRRRHDTDVPDSASTPEHDAEDAFTLVSHSTTAEIRKDMDTLDVDDTNKESRAHEEPQPEDAEPSRFMEGLLSHGQPPNMDNKMLTENADVAFRSTTNPLVDLFAELEEVISGPRLRDLLETAWSVDPLATLKIIFNARSIHLGKSSRKAFYRAAGWLAQNHPLTLVANLGWLSRPVIEKKAKKRGENDEDDVVLVESENVDERSKFDTKHGVAHGYWKDLLNVLVLAVNNKLDVLADPRDVLNVEDKAIARSMKRRRVARSGLLSGVATTRRARGTGRGVGRGRGGRSRGGRSDRGGSTRDGRSDRDAAPDPAPQHSAKQLKRETQRRRHDAAVSAFNDDPVYRALHLAVARLFAEQLEADLAALRGEDPKAKRSISLCGKWAPSHDHFHDRHTFIISSIAEAMYPRESLDDALSATDDRETYLKRARERYRKDMSALRAHLEVVERNIAAGTFDKIKYDRVPSLAMSAYSGVFIEKDFDRFEEYISRVAEGKANISGATMLPSTLIQKAGMSSRSPWETTVEKQAAGAEALLENKKKELEGKVVDGQWKTLVQRIKDSGTLSSSIAVCDVSGSMLDPTFSDGTRPRDSAIGLSLLVAEVTEPPFGGAFITFSENPQVENVDLSQTLREKVARMQSASWNMNTNFVKVFEKLILPMALKNKLKPEEMVKRVFVFSDMHFDSAETCSATRARGRDRGGEEPEENRWSTSYERIQGKFKDAGYEMPELVFWNLAGGRAGYLGRGGDATAPKPVTVTEEGTSLVSGYSQGMLKVFLDSGSFEEPEEESEDEVVVTKGQGDDVTAEPPRRKTKEDPLATVKKAIGHKAYGMLRVMD